MNTIARLEFERTYYNVAVHYVNHYTKETLQIIINTINYIINK